MNVCTLLKIHVASYSLHNLQEIWSTYGTCLQYLGEAIFCFLVSSKTACLSVTCPINVQSLVQWSFAARYIATQLPILATALNTEFSTNVQTRLSGISLVPML